MLILTRKVGESIVIGDNVRVFVLEVRQYPKARQNQEQKPEQDGNPSQEANQSEEGKQGQQAKPCQEVIMEYQVQVGIEAPRNIPIYREEIFRSIQRGEMKAIPWFPPSAGQQVEEELLLTPVSSPAPDVELESELQPAPDMLLVPDFELEDEREPAPLDPPAAAPQSGNGSMVEPPDAPK